MRAARIGVKVAFSLTDDPVAHETVVKIVSDAELGDVLADFARTGGVAVADVIMADFARRAAAEFADEASVVGWKRLCCPQRTRCRFPHMDCSGRWSGHSSSGWRHGLG
jgi:hypothetical protein